MQTFLPFKSYTNSALVLDSKRLMKQLVEVSQILRALDSDVVPNNKTGRKGWVNHPATKMWAGYERELASYGMDMSAEYMRRHPSRTHKSIGSILQYWTKLRDAAPSARPPWMGNPFIHGSHRQALVNKDPAHYTPLFPGYQPNDLPTRGVYVWPV